jgi:hypothetical protein
VATQPDFAIERLTATKKELVSLKEKNRYLETKLGLKTFELEETQLKNKDNLNFVDLNCKQMEDNLNILANERQPQYFCHLKIEDDLNI